MSQTNAQLLADSLGTASTGTVPIGGIILWSGSTGSVPTGWALCDGNNSTPNLQDRFVVGAGSGYAVDATGGSANAVLIAHNHTYTDRTNAQGNNFVTGGPSAITDGALPNQSTSTKGINAAGSTNNSQTGTNANLPPYYALAYIMRTS